MKRQRLEDQFEYMQGLMRKIDNHLGEDNIQKASIELCLESLEIQIKHMRELLELYVGIVRVY